MKTLIILTSLIIAAFAFVVIGCDKDTANTETPMTETTEQAENIADVDLDDATKDLAEEAAAGFESIKTAYVEKAGDLVSDWDQKIDGLVEKKEALPEIAQKPLEKPLEQIGAVKGELDTKYNDLKGAGEDTFDQKKEEFEGKLGDLSGAYKDILGKF